MLRKLVESIPVSRRLPVCWCAAIFAMASVAGAQSVTCRVFDDGAANASQTTDAIYFANPSKACAPDGTAGGLCRRWFGRCTASDNAAVLFRAFDDGAGNPTRPSDAVYARAPSAACVPDGTGSGTCRKWFGLAATADGRAVKCYLFNDGYSNKVGPTDAIYYRAPGQVCMPDGTATGTCRKWFGSCQVTGLVKPLEGGLYRESSRPEVYVIQGGKKIWIPTPDALAAMGFDWPWVQVVPDGTLQTLPRFNIPSSSTTPGSLVFPPNLTSHYPLTGMANATVVPSQGKQIQNAELRGWLRSMDDAGTCNGDEGSGADFHYGLELDTEWAVAQGLDLQKILRVGNIAHLAMRQQGSARNALAIPLVNVELNSWGWRSQFPGGANRPKDWSHVQSGCDKPVVWPFNPSQPDGKNTLKTEGDNRGSYVRMVGSLVTDSPHDVQTRPGTLFCRFLAICIKDEFTWEGSVPDWGPNPYTNPDHPARYTEMHPPDLIEILPEPDTKVTVRGLALAARVAATPGPIVPSCESQEFDLAPEAARPANTVVGWEELRGQYPALYFPWGENKDNGSWITSQGDKIHVKAQVCGGALGGSAGRFKAVYRVWWKTAPAPPPPPSPRKSCLDGCGAQQKACMAAAHSAGDRQACVGEFRACQRECPK